MYAKEPGLATSICGDRKRPPGKRHRRDDPFGLAGSFTQSKHPCRILLLVRGLLVLSTVGRLPWDKTAWNTAWKNLSLSFV